ncbi:MAG: acyltransferase [Aliidongia sp.]
MRSPAVERFDTLDGLRGVAAFSVMIGHFGQVLGSYWPAHMFLAVDVFFVMSGFVIAHSYRERLRGGMSAWTYLSRRLVRLYPLFILGLLLGAGILYYGASRGVIAYRTDDILRSVALNALYIPFLNRAQIYIDIGQIFPADPPAWSLFLEMLASAGFLVLFDLRRKALMLVTALCYLALIGAGFYFGRVNGAAGLDISNGFDSHNFLGGVPRVGFGFTLGILLHALTRDGIGTQRAAAVLRRVPYPSFVLYAALAAMFLFPNTVRGLYPLLALATVAPAIVFIGAQLRTGPGLETDVARFLGWVSYPVYCLHVPILRLVIFARGGVHGSALLVTAFSGSRDARLGRPADALVRRTPARRAVGPPVCRPAPPRPVDRLNEASLLRQLARERQRVEDRAADAASAPNWRSRSRRSPHASCRCPHSPGT